MHGQGNDFVMLNAIAQPEASTLAQAQVRAIADRHFGIGCDQLLLAEAPSDPAFDFRYRIFNADGNEVEHCGNGSRCFPIFVRDEGLTTKTRLRVETMNGVIVPVVHENGNVTVDMGVPRFAPADIPFQAESESLRYTLMIGDAANKVAREIGVLSMGNPHAVQVVASTETAPITSEGPFIETHPRFPKRVNAGFMQILARDRIRLRVWERGAGETLACGTGACAAVVTGIRWGLLDETVIVETRGSSGSMNAKRSSVNAGHLSVTWQGLKVPDAPVLMSGVPTFVYRGEIDV
jgi:diaminopimelate epimerase